MRIRAETVVLNVGSVIIPTHTSTHSVLVLYDFRVFGSPPRLISCYEY